MVAWPTPLRGDTLEGSSAGDKIFPSKSIPSRCIGEYFSSSLSVTGCDGFKITSRGLKES